MSAAEPLPLDPFCSAADPSRYVPRAATEQALVELRAALSSGPGALAFTGPAGIGKSLLLRVLAAQSAADYTFVCLQATPPGAEQVCESALHALGDPATSDPCGALGLRAALLARRGRPLVLLLDSVEALPAGALTELAELSADGLRCVLVASERDELEAALGALGPGLRRIRLSSALSRAETEEYLQARLEAADASPELRVRLLGTALDLWRRSRGNPQCLHAEISQVQLELWRAGDVEPRLRLLEREAPAEPEPAPIAADPVLGDLEVGAEVQTVPEVVLEVQSAERALQSAPLEAGPQREMRGIGRLAMFALGALSGGVAVAALVLALQKLGEPASKPARPAPVLAPVAVAPPPAPPEPVPPAAAPEPAPQPVSVASPPPVEPVAEPKIPQIPAPPVPERAAPARPAAPVRVQVQALPWATIYVDGELAGETPLGDLPLRPGLREFRAEMPDGRKLIKRVQVREGTRVLFE